MSYQGYFAFYISGDSFCKIGPHITLEYSSIIRLLILGLCATDAQFCHFNKNKTIGRGDWGPMGHGVLRTTDFAVQLKIGMLTLQIREEWAVIFRMVISPDAAVRQPSNGWETSVWSIYVQEKQAREERSESHFWYHQLTTL